MKASTLMQVPASCLSPRVVVCRILIDCLRSINSSASAFSCNITADPPDSPPPDEDSPGVGRSASLDLVDDVVDDQKSSNGTLPDGKTIASPSDPLRWFGIFVPPALRFAQQSFKQAVIDVVPALASVVHEMRVVENEIRRTRERISRPTINEAVF